ncbi:zinc ribbon domain-containing protein [Brasilonema bromeliae]|uniref:zinc ribbon domain-containing protein n=1 Tax=Brasilonema bromeliae TaxID=383615 RepID=UPI0024845E64|nr:zinc ribbon domain-containing protein [Brasilonema bromeliae]
MLSLLPLVPSLSRCRNLKIYKINRTQRSKIYYFTKNRFSFVKVDTTKTSQICPSCGTETGKKDLSERVHVCGNCGYTTDRDVVAAQVVLNRGCAAVGQTVKMRAGGKFTRTPMIQESRSREKRECQVFVSAALL